VRCPGAGGRSASVAAVPKPPVPDAIDAFLRQPNPAVIATVRADGSPHCVATWYDWDDGRVLVNMAASRARLGHLRRDPRVALTVLDEGSWYRHVSLLGHVTSLAPDPQLADIDRLATRYAGTPHADRVTERWSAWIEIDRWHAWEGSRPWHG
jgi:PPOX class probable F420-dependent enzyme